MRLNEQISEPEYVSKKHVLVNRKAELRGKLEAFERNRQNRFEPAIQFVSEAKQATILLAEGNREHNRDFLKKIGSNFHVADKLLAVEFKKPWNLLAEFNSARTTNLAACGEKSEKSNWRRERDSNPRYPFGVCTLSRRVPSTTRPSLPPGPALWPRAPFDTIFFRQDGGQITRSEFRPGPRWQQVFGNGKINVRW